MNKEKKMLSFIKERAMTPEAEQKKQSAAGGKHAANSLKRDRSCRGKLLIKKISSFKNAIILSEILQKYK